MAVYPRTLLSVNGGSGVTSDGVVVFTGNKKFYAGDLVWTDGQYVYGLQHRASVAIMPDDPVEGLPILAEKVGYYVRSLDWSDFELSKDDGIVNDETQYFALKGEYADADTLSAQEGESSGGYIAVKKTDAIIRKVYHANLKDYCPYNNQARVISNLIDFGPTDPENPQIPGGLGILKAWGPYAYPKDWNFSSGGSEYNQGSPDATLPEKVYNLPKDYHGFFLSSVNRNISGLETINYSGYWVDMTEKEILNRFNINPNPADLNLKIKNNREPLTIEINKQNAAYSSIADFEKYMNEVENLAREQMPLATIRSRANVNVGALPFSDYASTDKSNFIAYTDAVPLLTKVHPDESWESIVSVTAHCYVYLYKNASDVLIYNCDRNYTGEARILTSIISTLQTTKRYNILPKQFDPTILLLVTSKGTIQVVKKLAYIGIAENRYWTPTIKDVDCLDEKELPDTLPDDSDYIYFGSNEKDMDETGTPHYVHTFKVTWNWTVDKAETFFELEEHSDFQLEMQDGFYIKYTWQGEGVSSELKQDLYSPKGEHVLTIEKEVLGPVMFANFAITETQADESGQMVYLLLNQTTGKLFSVKNGSATELMGGCKNFRLRFMQDIYTAAQG